MDAFLRAGSERDGEVRRQLLESSAVEGVTSRDGEQRGTARPPVNVTEGRPSRGPDYYIRLALLDGGTWPFSRRYVTMLP